MHLSQKTKDLMEMVFMTGLDAFTNVHRLHGSLTSYGDWNHNSSYFRQMRAIKEKGLLDGSGPSQTNWIPALTNDGIDAIADLVEPERFWGQPWDKLWRTVTFDIPASERKERQRLDSWLQKKRFGHLQSSLWLSARPYGDWSEQITSLNIDPKSVIFIEGKPLGNLSHETIVSQSWPFETINAHYQEYLDFLQANPPSSTLEDISKSFADWFRKESQIWRTAIGKDPLLPRELHPPGYLGENCWAARKQAFANWKHLLCS